jgi:hypothetical protein
MDAGCQFLQRGNASKPHILDHALHYQYLPPNLKDLATNSAAASSLGAKLAKMEIVTSSQPQPSLSTTQLKISGQATLDHNFTRAGTLKLQTKMDHCILRLICVRGLVPALIDSPEWKELMMVANPKYKVTPSDLFVEVHIPNKAQDIQKKSQQSYMQRRT